MGYATARPATETDSSTATPIPAQPAATPNKAEKQSEAVTGRQETLTSISRV